MESQRHHDLCKPEQLSLASWRLPACVLLIIIVIKQLGRASHGRSIWGSSATSTTLYSIGT